MSKQTPPTSSHDAWDLCPQTVTSVIRIARDSRSDEEVASGAGLTPGIAEGPTAGWIKATLPYARADPLTKLRMAPDAALNQIGLRRKDFFELT